MIRLDDLPNKRADETVKLFLRRHWVKPFEIGFYMALMYLLPGIAAYTFNDGLQEWLAHPIFGPLLAIVICTYLFGVWLFGFLEFTDYFLDTWIVTNERIINVEQKGLFTRVASELHLSAVQDVTSEVKGMLHTFLDYGNVMVQTAAEKTRFNFKEISKPEHIKQEILRLVDEDKHRHELELRQSMSQPATPPKP